MRAAAVVAFLLLAGCGPIFGDRKPAAPPVTDVARERVVRRVLAALESRYQSGEIRAIEALPAIQDAAADAEGFPDWETFLGGVRAADPAADLAIARRITEKAKSLLDAPPASPTPR